MSLTPRLELNPSPSVRLQVRRGAVGEFTIPGGVDIGRIQGDLRGSCGGERKMGRETGALGRGLEANGNRA